MVTGFCFTEFRRWVEAPSKGRRRQSAPTPRGRRTRPNVVSPISFIHSRLHCWSRFIEDSVRAVKDSVFLRVVSFFSFLFFCWFWVPLGRLRSRNEPSSSHWWSHWSIEAEPFFEAVAWNVVERAAVKRRRHGEKSQKRRRWFGWWFGWWFVVQRDRDRVPLPAAGRLPARPRRRFGRMVSPSSTSR